MRFTWVILAALLLCTAAARAQSDVSMLLEDWPDKSVFQFNGEFILPNRGELSANGASARVGEFRSHARWKPIHLRDDMNPAIGYDWTHLDVGSSGGLLPSHLDDFSMAIGTPLAQAEGWFFAGLVGFGSAGDDVFDDGWYAKAQLIAGRKFSDSDSLIVGIDYNGNREYLPDLPLPGFAWEHKVSEQLSFVVGSPDSSITWRPAERWKVHAEFSIPASFETSIEYQIARSLTLYGALTSDENAFHLHDMRQTQRLFYLEDRLELGTRWQVAGRCELTAAGGWLFNRRFARGYDDLNLSTVTDVSDEPFLRFGLEFHF